MVQVHLNHDSHDSVQVNLTNCTSSKLLFYSADLDIQVDTAKMAHLVVLVFMALIFFDTLLAVKSGMSMLSLVYLFDIKLI